MIVDEDYYLQHYGKKGMKWGVRNTARNAVLIPNSPAAKGLNRVERNVAEYNRKLEARTPEQIKSDKRKERAVIAAGAVAVGGIYALKILAAHHAVKVSRLR